MKKALSIMNAFVTADAYCLEVAIREGKPGKHHGGVHSMIMPAYSRRRLEVIPHPLYSPDIAPLDFISSSPSSPLMATSRKKLLGL